MVRVTRLARRAWQMRHDPESIVAGLDRLGVRIPGSGSYRHRSPQVGALVDRAWAGHVTRSLANLEALTLEGGRVGDDALLALVDWHLTHDQPELAQEFLGRCKHRSTEAIGLRLEAWSLVDGSSPLPLSARDRRRARRHPQIRWLLANADPDRLGLWNHLLVAEGFSAIQGSGSIGSLTSQSAPSANGPLVTVIIPVHNAAGTIEGALRSILNQSWSNLEVIVVDDASTDDSDDIVETIQATDSRVRLERLPINVGTYTARNHGLKVARGVFVTVHDADDWCHPDRIRTQAQHLVNHPLTHGNVTSLVRATQNLTFSRRGFITNQVVGLNYSSLLARRKLFETLGPWDEVRVAGDSEFIDRAKARYGKAAVANLHPNVPLAVALSDPQSLIRSPATGITSSRLSTGTRRLYHLAASHWHNSPGFTIQLPTTRASDRQPFVAPHLLRHRSTSHRFDVVILSDLALPGGTTASNLTEIVANESLGWTTGLLHNRNPSFRDTGPNPKFFAATSDRTRFISYGEDISCRTLVIKYPPSVGQIPDVFPEVHVDGQIVSVINQTPFTGYSGERRKVYDLMSCDTEIERTFGKRATWTHTGPSVLEILMQHHEGEIAQLQFDVTPWYEIIDSKAWQRPGRPSPSPAIRIGRHGRDDVWKWPATKDALLAAYPDDATFDVRILGGADHAKKVIGSIPSNWTVQAFDSVSPHTWLANLDVFVYFPHPDMVEAFGRTILEALAVGVPVVCDARFAPVFGDSVITCPILDVRSVVRELMLDSALYDNQVAKGWHAIEQNFSFTAHRLRLEQRFS